MNDLKELLTDADWGPITNAPFGFWVLLVGVAGALGTGLWQYAKHYFQGQMANVQGQIANLQAQIGSLEKMVQLKDTQMAVREESVKTLTGDVTTREALIAGLESAAKSRDEAIAAYEADAKERARQIDDLTSQLKKAQTELGKRGVEDFEINLIPINAGRIAEHKWYGGGEIQPINPQNLRLIDLQKAVAARRLTSNQKAAISQSLADGPTGRLDIITASNADQPDGLRDDLQQAFRDVGWRVETMNSLRTDPSRAGLQLVVSDPANLNEFETRVHEALFGANLPHDLIRAHKSVEAQIRIVPQAR